ncbi:thioredoxin family protein [Vibrio makurazakiensis]
MAFSTLTFAQSTGWVSVPEHPPVKLRMMSTGQQDLENKSIEAVLDIELDGDWKTYWRSPGEGGVAPEWDWSASSNIQAVEWHWPIPSYYEQLGVMTLGYKSKVSFPITITLEDNTKPAVFDARLRLPSCTNICVITDYSINLPIDPNTLQLDEDAMFVFNQGMSRTPMESKQVSVDGLFWDKSKQQLVAQFTNQKEWNNPQILIDGDEVVDEFFAQPKIIKDNGTLTAIFDVSNWLGETDLTQRNITITISDETFATELTGQIGSTPISYQSNDTSFLAMVGFALLGGLILNIMPCVLPVLGMKLNSMVANQDASTKHIRGSFVASASGIVTSFALLAAGISVLKLGGNAIGWGIQFQNAWFIAFMLIITLVFATNLLGLFEFQLPSSMNTWMATKGNDSHSGHFIQGMFATLLATPCSAPFLGTAVAYAFGASYQELWAIFIALGLGMSAPWLTFALFPSLIRFLPKPGAWMFKVKLFFGLMMLATSLWLSSLLMPFIGKFPALLMTTTILITVLIWIGVKLGRKVMVPVLAISTVAFGGGLIAGSLTADSWATPIVDDLNWQPLDANAIPEFVAQGKTVFVNVTADWCITCKANKIGVILQDPVYSGLQAEDMILMEGDWTTPNQKVTDYLQSNGRYGVPFNIVYGPNYQQGIPLPVILNSETVMDAIKVAKGTNE